MKFSAFNKIQYEWQIAALGFSGFQSWKLEENSVPAALPRDTIEVFGKGKKVLLPVRTEVDYPWWGAYNYRKRAQNQQHCFLGNFTIRDNVIPRELYKSDKDGFAMTAPVGRYFPNNIGVYDVVGNVAEMIDQKGKACGGSWQNYPEESTIRSVFNYEHPQGNIGFRVIMEIIER